MQLKHSNQQIISLLTTHKLPFWLDCQSLKRAVDEGPNAIDTMPILQLGLKAEDLDVLRNLYPVLKGLGYHLKEYYWKGELFYLSLTQAPAGHIQFYVYRPVNSLYYCPVLQELVRRPYISSKISCRVKSSIKKLLLPFLSRVEVAKPGMKPLFKLATCLVPQTYFQNITLLCDSENLPVPADFRAYIDQRFPAENTDAFIKEERPQRLIREQEYRSFTDLLHRHNIPYCMDSGVLLGLMREGRIFPWEKDVDLQMWQKDADQVLAIIPELKEKGWIVTLWQYKGVLYQIRIQRPGKIPVHIMLFSKEGEHAWCPAGRTMGNPYIGGIPRRLFVLFNKIRIVLRNRLVTTDVAHWPWNVQRQLATWWVPAAFFENTIFSEKHQTYLPADWDNYLTFRYGNWRIPVTDWDFWVDDGAMNHKRPEELVELAASH